MKFKNISYYTVQAFKSIFRNKLMSFATIFTVAISLCVVGSFVLFLINTTTFIEAQGNKTQLTAFINSNYNEIQVKEIGNNIKNMTNVKEIFYISKEEAMQKQSKRYGGEAQWKEIFGNENPLPYTYNISTTDAKELDNISMNLKLIKGIYKVDYAKELVTKLVNIIKKIKIIGISIIAVLFLSAIFLISTTIKLSVYAKRKEIMVMKYVGSSDNFIRGPFLVIGMILGLIGSLIASLILFGLYYHVVSRIAKSIVFLQLHYDSFQIFSVIIGIIISGLFIGIMGSSISLNKYLKV